MVTTPILPYVLLAASVCTSVAGVGGYLFGRSDGKALEAAQQLTDEQLVAKAAGAAQTAAAKAIAGIQIKHTTIRQQAEKEIRENTVYRNAECTHPDSVLRQINAALTGTEPIGGGQLPSADAAGRSDLRRDDAEADRRGQPVPAVQGGITGGGD